MIYFDPKATDLDRVRRSLAKANTLLNESVGGLQPLDDDLTTISELEPVQGDVLFYGPDGWALLTGGTSGQVITSGGAGANPTWATPSSSITLTSSTSAPVGTGAVGLFHIDTSAHRFYWGEAGSWRYVTGTLLSSTPATRATRLTAMGVPGIFAEAVYGP